MTYSNFGEKNAKKPTQYFGKNNRIYTSILDFGFKN